MNNVVTYTASQQSESQPFIVGYKGQSGMDTSYYFCPYFPGMTDEQMAEVNVKNRYVDPTEIQLRIMDIVRNGTAQVHGPG